MSGVAATYYVATTGNDSTGDGSVGNPWATIQKAISTAGDATLVNVRAGTYQVNVTSSAARKKRVTIRPNPGETVTLQRLDLIDSCRRIRLVGFNYDKSAGFFPNIRGQHIDIIGGSWNTGITIQEGARHIRIDGCEIGNPVGSGIILSATAAEPLIEHVWLRRLRLVGNAIDDFQIKRFYHVVIDGCEVRNHVPVDAGANHPDVVEMTTVTGTWLEILNCYFHDNEAAGIFLKPQTTAVGHVLIANTIVTGVVGGYEAFNPWLVDGLYVVGCFIDGTYVYQSTANDVYVLNNVLASHKNSGGTVDFNYRDHNWIENNALVGSFAAEPNGIVNQAPVFESEAGGDFRLVAGSVGLNAGTPLSVLPAPVRDRLARLGDRRGNARSATTPDLGPDER